MTPSHLILSARTIEDLLVQLNARSHEGFRAARFANVVSDDAGMLNIRVRRSRRPDAARVRYTADRFVNAGIVNYRINTLVGKAVA
jgi:hypothetical protein